MAATSLPDSRLSRGRKGLQLERHEDGRVSRKTYVRQVFAFQVQGDSLPQISRHFIQCPPLCYDRNSQTLGNVS